MPKRKKAKRKTKAKRKKTSVTKATTRRKTATVRKKSAKKARVGRASRKKARPTATAAVKAPSLPAQPTPPGERIGVVTHYYSDLSVATLRLESGTLRVGDVIHIRGHTTDFGQRVESIEVNHLPATEVGPNDDFGLKVVAHTREHDVVYKVRA